MSPLAHQLLGRIKAEGPMRLDAFMAACLMDPEHGYYATRDPFGQGGDFITAPEISQIFGELIGLWLVNQWEILDRPTPVHLVELGPGRGTLMADILRSLRVAPTLLEAVQVHLVETSETLRASQAKKVTANWHSSLADVPLGPTLLVANEFFDALPIRQFKKAASGWREHFIIADGDGLASTWDSIDEGLPKALTALDVEDGAIYEMCPAAITVMDQIAQRLTLYPGTALCIDYGYARSAPGDSLQAVRNHQYVPILDQPGRSDLTAHVNFEVLANVALARRAWPTVAVPQGQFLDALGINVRAQMLMRNASADQARQIPAAVRRLVAPDMMGELFKAMAISSPGVDLPAAFPSWWQHDET